MNNLSFFFFLKSFFSLFYFFFFLRFYIKQKLFRKKITQTLYFGSILQHKLIVYSVSEKFDSVFFPWIWHFDIWTNLLIIIPFVYFQSEHGNAKPAQCSLSPLSLNTKFVIFTEKLISFSSSIHILFTLLNIKKLLVPSIHYSLHHKNWNIITQMGHELMCATGTVNIR